MSLKKSAFNLLAFVLVVLFFLSLIFWFFNKFIIPVISGPQTKDLFNQTNQYIVNETNKIASQYGIQQVQVFRYCEKDLVTGQEICKYEVADLTPMEFPKNTMIAQFVLSLQEIAPVILLSLIVVYLFSKKII